MSGRLIRVGDVVRWHAIGAEWTVVAIHGQDARIECDLVEGDTVRRISRPARVRDLTLIGEQLGLGLD